jgi:hypothetical protein
MPGERAKMSKLLHAHGGPEPLIPPTPSRTPSLTVGGVRAFFRSWAHRYASNAKYWRLDGRPVMNVLTTTDFAGRYGVEKFACLLRLGVQEVREEIGVLPYLVGVIDKADEYARRIVDSLPIDGVTGYGLLPTWQSEPIQDYSTLIDTRVAEWYEFQSALNIPFYPVVCAGWDATARATRKPTLERGDGYPYTPVVSGVTAELFGRFLDLAAEFNARHLPRHNLIFVHAWNEWTEGSAIEPNDRFGSGFLDQIRSRAIPVGGR